MNLFGFVVLAIQIFGANNYYPPDAVAGLWEITSVSNGDQVMTPVARWISLNADGTQYSGNGWSRHSEGTWEYNDQRSELRIVNTNGLEDPYNPFSVTMKDSVMIWTRPEDGNEVVAILRPISDIPKAPGDRLTGLWAPDDNGNQEGDELSGLDPDGNNSLLFRWDSIFSEHDGAMRVSSGVYKVHGHKQEIEFIYYGDDCRREWWEFDFERDRLVMRKMNVDQPLVRFYVRTNRFND